jgi:hypothetical protein
MVRLSVYTNTGENDGYPFDHLRQQPNAKVHEASSGRVIGHATLEDDTSLPTKHSLLSLPYHAAMFYRQDPMPGNSQLENRGWQVSLSYCLLLKPIVENRLFQRCGYAEVQPRAFYNAKMTAIAVI